MRKYLSLSLCALEAFGFWDVAKSQFVTDFSEQLAIFKGQDVQDNLILANLIDRLYRDLVTNYTSTLRNIPEDQIPFCNHSKLAVNMTIGG